MSANNGGPAFPQHVLTPLGSGAGSWSTVGGITLRDYFAARFAARMLADEVRPYKDYSYSNAAIRAYALADAMLAERAK